MPTDIEKRFASRGVTVGSVFIMQPETAIEFVEQCRSSEVCICGVEGFLRFGDRIQPQQEHSLDFEAAQSGACHDLTIAFLRAREGSTLWFEVVSDEPQ